MPAVEDSDELNRVRVYMQDMSEEISKLQIYPRSFGRYPFDHVGLALISKGFSVANALLVLLGKRFAEEAYGLSRSLVECALTLRFLTQDPNKLNRRTWDYVRFDVTDKQFWMYYALQFAAGQPMEQKIRDRAKQFGLKDDRRGALTHWSGKRNGFAWRVNIENHPLDNATSTELVKKSIYAVDYHQTSSFVHCFSPAVNSFLPTDRTAFGIREFPGEWGNPSQKTLIILVSYLHSCVAYVLFGMNMERTQWINDLFSGALAALLPYRSMWP